MLPTAQCWRQPVKVIARWISIPSAAFCRKRFLPLLFDVCNRAVIRSTGFACRDLLRLLRGRSAMYRSPLERLGNQSPVSPGHRPAVFLRT